MRAPHTPIVTRAPMRISFGGGGTDLEAYYARHGGFVVSAAISRYAYVVAGPSASAEIRINSADYRHWETLRGDDLTEPGALSLPRAVLEGFAGSLGGQGVDLFLTSEVPPGTGLGSSSAMTTALLAALHTYTGRPIDPPHLAESACEIEIGRMGMPIGKQDQYASAFGGLNATTFSANGVTVTPLRVDPDVAVALNHRLLLFSTGQSRNSADILREQRAHSGTSPTVIESLHVLKDLAHQMRETLEEGDLDRFGLLLHTGWQYKKRLSARISSAAIDGWYETAREAGALGGKITGAGGGGFLLLYVPPERQEAVRQRLSAQGLSEMGFDFDDLGAQVVAAPAPRPAVTTAVGGLPFRLPVLPTQDPDPEETALPVRAVATAADLLLACYQRGGTAFLLGNGPQAAVASQVARDMMKGTTRRWIPPFRVVLLNDTAPPDTEGHPSEEGLLAERLDAFAAPGDVCLAFSTGGTPADLLAAVRRAREHGLSVVALTGARDAAIESLADVSIPIVAHTPRQLADCHRSLGHSICVALRARIRAEADISGTLPRLAR